MGLSSVEIWGKLVNGVLKHTHVRLALVDEVVSIVCLLEANGFKDCQAAVHLGNSCLNSCILKVHLPEFLIGRVFLEVFDKGADCLKACLCDTWCSKLGVKCLDGLDAVLY